MQTSPDCCEADTRHNESGPARTNGTDPSNNSRTENKAQNTGGNKPELPQFLRDLIASPPPHGDGVHKWLFKVARQLHAHRDSETIVSLLTAAADGCGRHVPEREIRAAVEDARTCAWQPSGAQGKVRVASSLPKWPPLDQTRRSVILTESPLSLADTADASPTLLDGLDAEWFIDQLFPGNPLLCVGESNSEFLTLRREGLRGILDGMSLIVPSPMSALKGRKKNPEPDKDPLSAHTLDNTGPRRFLITEFDSGTPDEQTAVIDHLSGFGPLVMILSSGGKSLHAWWRCWDATEDAMMKFFRYAVSLGADPATWTRSQFVRLPMGWRPDTGRRQEVYFFDPSMLEGRGA